VSFDFASVVIPSVKNKDKTIINSIKDVFPILLIFTNFHPPKEKIG
jgi:hypothetical protein